MNCWSDRSCRCNIRVEMLQVRPRSSQEQELSLQQQQGLCCVFRDGLILHPAGRDAVYVRTNLMRGGPTTQPADCSRQQ